MRLAGLALKDDDPVLDRETIAELKSVAAAIGQLVPASQPLLTELASLGERAAGKRLSEALREMPGR
ncbi:MAG: hypothetical protein ACRDRG_11975 [Pseudonocardiaceae bacterium]